MPVTIDVDPKANLVTYTATGDIDFTQTRDAYESVFDHPDFRTNMNAMCDAREAVITLTVGEIAKLKDVLKSHQGERGSGYRVAIVVAGSPDFGLSTLFEMQTYGLPFELKVFRSFTQASEWLAGGTK